MKTKCYKRDARLAEAETANHDLSFPSKAFFSAAAVSFVYSRRGRIEVGGRARKGEGMGMAGQGTKGARGRYAKAEAKGEGEEKGGKKGKSD